MKLFKLFLSLFLLFILFDSSIAETKYIRETVFEVAENEEPLNLKISFSFPNPFSSSNSFDYTIGSFDIDNSGNIIFIPYGYTGILRPDFVSIFNINENKYIKFNSVKDEVKFHGGNFGPDNKLYFYNTYSPAANYKIMGFMKYNERYIHDRNINMSEINGFKMSLNISPDSCFYINISKREKENVIQSRKVLDYQGKYIQDTDAMTQNADGVEISEIFYPGLDHFVFVETDEGNILICSPYNQKYDVKKLKDSRLKCTFDKRIIISSPMFKYSFMKRPVIVIYDTKNDDYNIIDTKLECPRDDYEYFNVSSVNFNYIGEIYALVVYFNTPSEITGDEKIVLYRWRKIEE